jgi:hypothetical protein
MSVGTRRNRDAVVPLKGGLYVPSFWNDWRRVGFDAFQIPAIGVARAVSDSDAWLYRLNYNITLLGKIVFIASPVIF